MPDLELTSLESVYNQGSETPEVNQDPIDIEGEKPQEAAPPAVDKEEVETKEPGSIPLTALLDERQKRQESERREQDLKKQLENLQAQKTALTEEDLEDPVRVYNLLNQQMLNERLMLSEQLLLATKEDGEEMLNYFVEKVVVENPALSAEMTRQQNPAAYAYKAAKQHKIATEVGTDPAAYEAKVRAKIMAELEAAKGTKTPAQPAANPMLQVPASLVNQPSANVQPKALDYNDPQLLNKIFNT
jgi:hypothetical protein